MKSDLSVRVSARAHKMSKSRGNVINPDDVVAQFGADSLRLYEMFMGPLRDTKARAAWGGRDLGRLGEACTTACMRRCLHGHAWRMGRCLHGREHGACASHADPPAPRGPSPDWTAAGVEHPRRGGRAPLPRARVARV